MIQFLLFNHSSLRGTECNIDPQFVASIVATQERMSNGTPAKLAVITMSNGDKFTVFDQDNSVARKIMEAKEARPTPKKVAKQPHGGIGEDEP